MIPSCCNRRNTRSKTPFFAQRFIRTYITCQSPYSLGRLLHLHPFSTTYSTAFNTSRLLILAGFRCLGKHSLICSYCSFFKWIFKTFAAVLVLSNTFNIVMAVFDVSQHVVQQSAGLIQGSTAVTPEALDNMQAQLETMELSPLLGIFLQSFFVQFTMTALNIVVFVIVYGRMIEIYLMTSLAPIPFATIANREAGHMGHNYFKSLFAVGFQGMLIMVCMAIYAVLVQGIATGGDLMGAIWTCVGYTVLLCFVLFKTGSLSKSIWGAH